MKITLTVLMLFASNIFMTYAWYGHLKNLSTKFWLIAVLSSWAIAFFEYLIQVPANRIGYTLLSLDQLKIIQEVVSLTVFVLFTIFYMKQEFRVNYIYAGICLMGAVFFIFKK